MNRPHINRNGSCALSLRKEERSSGTGTVHPRRQPRGTVLSLRKEERLSLLSAFEIYRTIRGTALFLTLQEDSSPRTSGEPSPFLMCTPGGRSASQPHIPRVGYDSHPGIWCCIIRNPACITTVFMRRGQARSRACPRGDTYHNRGQFTRGVSRGELSS